jgi:hypothetical protein
MVRATAVCVAAPGVSRGSRTLKGWICASLGAAALLATEIQAAELPSLHQERSKDADAPSESGKGFDIPGSGLHVTYGGYIEGAVTATLPKNAAGDAAKRRKPMQ